MPIFGDFETFGEPIAITEDRGHVSTVWRARKIGEQGDPAFAVKCYAPQRRRALEAGPDDALEKDPAQEFLAGIKQLQKAQKEGDRNLVPIYDLGFADEGAWYVTDFYPRNTLKAWIARRGGVDSAALRQVVQCIVAGCLALKRSRGYSHGNLKAANVFLVGKPRPLRSTPLHLGDGYPAAPLQLAGLGRADRREVDELLHQVAEVQDLRALGELLLQLVEGRLVNNAYDYNYPVASSSAWTNLGGDGERWRELCNRLLDPQLTLEKVNLESLAKEFRPSGITPHLPKILVGAGAVCVIVVGVYLGLHLVNRGREGRQKAEAARIATLISESKSALMRNDFATAIAKSDEALLLKSDSSEAAALKTEAGGKLEAAYQNEITLAQRAMVAEEFDEAAQIATRALQLKKGDKVASELIKTAQARRNELLTQAERDRSYQQALAAGASALQRNDYTNALKQAEIALGYRANDAAALKLKLDAETGQKNLAAQAARDENYQKAMTAGRAALTRNEYVQAIAEAERALGFRANDAGAKALKAEAETKQNEAKTQAERDRSYQQALVAGASALQRNDYTNALKQAEIALGYRANDAAALKLKLEAETGQKNLAAQVERDENYQKAMTAGKAALTRNEYPQAIAAAERALGFRANDAEAKALKADAETRQNEAKTQVERDRGYQQALAAGVGALQRNDYTNALKQAEIALGYRANDAAALKLKLEAETGQKNLAAQAARDENYQKAMTAGKAALTRNEYPQAIAEAERALVYRANDAAAKALKADAEVRQKEAQTQADREKKYQVAMEAATNALDRAEAAFKRFEYDEALREVKAGLGECEKARGQNATAAVDQFKGVLEGKQGLVQLKQDYRSATNYFAKGNYVAALQSSERHIATDASFQALAVQIKEEQNVFLSATNKFSTGDYSFSTELDRHEYKAKPPFAELLRKSAEEQKVLGDLEKLRQANRWQAIPGELNKLASAVSSKKPFRDFGIWADGKAVEEEKARQGVLTKLDAKLEPIRKQLLGGKKPQWMTVPESTEKRITTDMGDPLIAWFKKQIDDIEKDYASTLDKERRDLIRDLRSDLGNRQ